MRTKDIEECKIKQKEYEKIIRDIDLKIVEKNVKIYDLLKSSNNKINTEIEKLNNEINALELQKIKETNNLIVKIKEIKEDITDVYFNLDKIRYIDNNKEIIMEENKDTKNVEDFEYLSKLSQNMDTNKKEIFNIKEQRVIDFENFFRSINNLAKIYIKEIEELIYKYIKEEKYLEKIDDLEYKAEKIQNQFILYFEKQVEKFKKDENILEVSIKVQEIYKDNKDIECKIKNSEEETKVLKEKLDNLQDVYFVNAYAKKIIKTFFSMQLKKEIKIKNAENKADDEIYNIIKNIAKKNRITNMVKVDKWSNEIIRRINKYNIREKEYETLVSIIRKTENNCNIQLEQILNSIILLCDNYISLENVETENNARKKVLAQNMSILMVLTNGLDIIKKKYSKIPIIGRKILYILEPKLIDIK